MEGRQHNPQQNRMRQVCDYIGQHLDDDLNLERLSQVGHLSRFHFHRLFLAATGMALSRYVLLQRLKRASFRLAFEPQRKVIDIGLEAGFDSAEAFSRAFKRYFNQTPSQFRSSPDWPNWHSVMTLATPVTGEIKVDVNIVEMAPQNVAQLTHSGDPARLMETAKQFIEWRKNSGLSPIASSRTYGIPNGDPNTMAPEAFRFRFCGTLGEVVIRRVNDNQGQIDDVVDGDPANGNDYSNSVATSVDLAMNLQVPVNPQGVVNGIVAGGRYAVLRHLGSHDGMDAIIYAFFREWLPASGESIRDEPLFFHYINFIHQVDECDLITDIYLPLE